MKKNRITHLLETKSRNILSVYFTAGFPLLESTLVIAKALEDAGADLIEIGIPFSDPVADGPVIQESNKVALDNGMDLRTLLSQVNVIRESVKIPIILMGYINPVMQFGVERFCKEAAAAGVDGLILPDLPIDEYVSEYEAIVSKNGLINTFLISPTTSDERIRTIDAHSSGFIYAVSASSITGAKGDFSAGQENYFQRLRGMKLKNPFLVGFGVSNHRTFAAVCRHAAGAIVGSAFITALKGSTDLKTDISKFVRSLRTEINQ